MQMCSRARTKSTPTWVAPRPWGWATGMFGVAAVEVEEDGSPAEESCAVSRLGSRAVKVVGLEGSAGVIMGNRSLASYVLE